VLSSLIGLTLVILLYQKRVQAMGEGRFRGVGFSC